MIKILAILTLLIVETDISAQKLLHQKRLGKYHIAPANYSGITHLSADTFAVVDDKSPTVGFYLFTIQQDSITGKIHKVSTSPFISDGKQNFDADCEDIAYVPKCGTLFITSEHNQSIQEYNLDGQPTGRTLSIPPYFHQSNIENNAGFEALTYDANTDCFWTTTERPVKGDSSLCLRLQRFDSQMTPQEYVWYIMDKPEFKPGKYYAHGVPALLAVGDGRLLVMERELTVSKSYLGSKTRIKIYVVSPLEPLSKQLLFSFTTHLKLGHINYANYEGMCWGKTLVNGQRTLLLINDSQNGAGNAFCHLKDYIKVIVGI